MATHSKEDPKTLSQKNPNKNETTAAKKTEDAVSYHQLSRGVPLAAKDSEWIGLETDYLNTEGLFPGVQFNGTAESTTVITKLLVGHNPDASLLQKHKKLYKPNTLPIVKEPSNSAHPSESSIDIKGTTAGEFYCSEDGEPYDGDDDEEPKRAMHRKRRKKKSDIILLPNDESSVSILETARKKSSSRSRHSSKTRQTSKTQNSTMEMSNDADDEYMTHSEDKISDKQI